MNLREHEITSLRRIKSDTEIVKAEARHLILLNSENEVSYVRNTEGKLNIIAIVGPSISPVHGKLNQVILCEIGISRVRPYRIAEQPKRLHDPTLPKTIKERKKLFYLTEVQYIAVAEKIFELMRNITEKRVGKRKTNLTNPFKRKIEGNYWLRSKKNLISNKRTVEIENGVRFSIFHKDVYLAQDIHWAELYGNKTLEIQLKRCAIKLCFPLKHYYELRTRKKLKDLPKYQQILDIMSSKYFPQHLKIRMLGFMREKEKSYFEEDLREILSWDGTPPLQQYLAAKALEGVKKRTKGIRMRMIYRHRNPNIFVCGVFANEHIENSDKQHCEEPEELEEVPF